ncbi:MAG: hypothetical protein GWN62_05955, partial [Aliifodinibius sp.]|nr:hypothetical protein [Fodinibius sp.]
MNGESSKGKRKVCRYCAKQIPVQAFVCHNCGWHQNRFWQHFRFEHFGLIIALAMMGLAYLQFREARKERIAATDALQLARQAEAAALNTAADIEKVYTEVAH